MPGIDPDLAALGLDALPGRLARLLLEATDAVERQAADGGRTSPEAIARSVGVIARTGAALVSCIERLARLRARREAPGDLHETEEADMDDAEEPGARRPADESRAVDAARLARRLRTLAGNLQIGGGAACGDPGDGSAAARSGAGKLAGECGAAPAAA